MNNLIKELRKASDIIQTSPHLEEQKIWKARIKKSLEKWEKKKLEKWLSQRILSDQLALKKRSFDICIGVADLTPSLFSSYLWISDNSCLDKGWISYIKEPASIKNLDFDVLISWVCFHLKISLEELGFDVTRPKKYLPTYWIVTITW